MSELRNAKFATTVIGQWIREPDRPVAHEAAEADAALQPKNGQGPTGLALWSPPVSTAITTRAWPSKVFVLDEVELPARADARLVMLREPESERARSYRLLQHRLLARSDPRVIVVTSAEPGEGKTTVAVNLALALADETMARILLVEANLRRPALAKLFCFEPGESFVGRMAEHREVVPPYSVAAILGTRLQIAALPSSVAPDARLDRLLLGEAIGDLRDAYDYIVIDAASVLESADTDVVAECADGVIVAARSRKSRKNALRRAVRELSPATVFGTVLLDS
jgi:Mrp family chromosome partitioning ATPase